MSPQATALSPQALIQAATASIFAYNEKNWDRLKASITPDFVYDEVATQRVTRGADDAIAVMKEWAQAIPDSKATIDGGVASGNTVVLELTWQGTHRGQLSTMSGSIPPSGRSVKVRACAVMEMNGERVSRERHYFDLATLLRQVGVTV